VKPVGHDSVREQLTLKLPAVALLTGLPGVGKWVLAEHLAEIHASEFDRVMLRGKWGVREARAAGKCVQVAPAKGAWRIVTADLGATTQPAQSALLKVLEEPMPFARFVLVAEPGIALPTIASRAFSYYLAPLSMADTIGVLESLGLSGPEAAAAAVLAPGRPGAAYGVAKDALVSRDRVREVLSAVRDANGRHLDRLFRKWTAVDSLMLGVWAQEASTGAWRVFTAKDAPRKGRRAALVVLRERAASNARPQIADRRIMDIAMQRQLF